jgi:hypothetical protein
MTKQTKPKTEEEPVTCKRCGASRYVPGNLASHIRDCDGGPTAHQANFFSDCQMLNMDRGGPASFDSWRAADQVRDYGVGLGAAADGNPWRTGDE